MPLSQASPGSLTGIAPTTNAVGNPFAYGELCLGACGACAVGVRLIFTC
jgi:hypothetical protein